MVVSGVVVLSFGYANIVKDAGFENFSVVYAWVEIRENLLTRHKFNNLLKSVSVRRDHGSRWEENFDFSAF